MSNAPARPKSTLAVDKFRAASRPLGAPLADAAAARPDAVTVMGTARAYRPESREVVSKVPVPARAPARPAPPKPPAAAPAPVARTVATPATTREQRDGLLVSSIVIAFVLVALVIGSIQVSGNMRVDRSKTALTGALSTVYQRQTEFRILNRRFATWPELEARGMALPPTQRVVKSNATASHWFIALRDGETGMVCSRTGELFDDSPLDRTPTCTPAAP